MTTQAQKLHKFVAAHPQVLRLSTKLHTKLICVKCGGTPALDLSSLFGTDSFCYVRIECQNTNCKFCAITWTERLSLHLLFNRIEHADNHYK